MTLATKTLILVMTHLVAFSSAAYLEQRKNRNDMHCDIPTSQSSSLWVWRGENGAVMCQIRGPVYQKAKRL